MIVCCVQILLLMQTLCGFYASSSPYRIYDMIPQGICKMRRIPLLDNLLTQSDPIQLSSSERGAIFRQSWNSSTFKRFSDCKFYLQAPTHMGLYLSISKVQLRKNSRGNCIDNVVVKKSSDKKYQFCDMPDDGETKVFSDDRGWMRVTVNLDTTLALSTLEDTLEVQFIVTVKRKCNEIGYLPCEKDEDDSCISKSFFGDGFVNCPECVDEEGCFNDSEQVLILNPSNVFLSAIISLFATMLVFGACLWCVYRHRRCIATCNSNHSAGMAHSNRENLESVPASDQIQVELHTSSANFVQPTAPIDDDKDLPPAYDSLFPVAPVGR
ncbi:uncharacterized protein LOC131691936 [Topomyia yanbarensis]|uniref:uncharacterized protein LOC131691936 n=1 Tax=Topomyia yanbarensis TaxID=2498891 RepID=UPI00273AD7A2|nr:uncharacterized protein LOC131691936 [Topomyia yanbarensis]